VFFAEIDYVAQTINIWNGLTLVSTYTHGAPFATSIDADLGSNPFGEGVEIGFSYINPDDEPAAPWPHKGMAMLRKALTEAEREEWIAYNWCTDCTIACTAILLYDTRLWTEGDPELENLGSAGPGYNLPILTDGAYTNAFGLQANDYYAEKVTASTLWFDFGGPPGVRDGIITIIIATGNPGDGAGYADIRWWGLDSGNPVSISGSIENWDGTTGPPETVANVNDPIFFTNPGLGPVTHSTSPTPAYNTVYFFEISLASSTPSVEIRQGETLVASDTHTAYGAGVVDNRFAINDDGIVFTIVGADTGWPSGEPWRMRGSAMVRGALDTAGRAAWQSYFLD
jgi:hypothetical protein